MHFHELERSNLELDIMNLNLRLGDWNEAGWKVAVGKAEAAKKAGRDLGFQVFCEGRVIPVREPGIDH